jgi:hypothetical protein
MIRGSDKAASQARINVKNARQIVGNLERGQGILNTMTLWMDLLGFRSHLDDHNWDLHRETTLIGMQWIAAFHEVALLSMNDRYEVVQLNDAVVVSQDIPAVDPAKAVEEFLALVDSSFEQAVLTDAAIGGVGIRGVVAKGVRYNLRGNLGWTPTNRGNLRRPSFFCPRPVMMNTAFGRAYGVESSGQLKKASGLYVERSLAFDFGARIMETWDLDQAIEVRKFGAFLLVRS